MAAGASVDAGAEAPAILQAGPVVALDPHPQKQSKSEVGATVRAILVRSAGAMRFFAARFFHCSSRAVSRASRVLRSHVPSRFQNSDPYLVAQISETDHRIFNDALCTLTRATVALLELFVMRRIGKAQFGAIATDFVKQDAHNLTARMLRARITTHGITL